MYVGAELLMYWAAKLWSPSERARARWWMGQFIDYGYEVRSCLTCPRPHSHCSPTTSTATFEIGDFPDKEALCGDHRRVSALHGWWSGISIIVNRVYCSGCQH